MQGIIFPHVDHFHPAESPTPPSSCYIYSKVQGKGLDEVSSTPRSRWAPTAGLLATPYPLLHQCISRGTCAMDCSRWSSKPLPNLSFKVSSLSSSLSILSRIASSATSFSSCGKGLKTRIYPTEPRLWQLSWDTSKGITTCWRRN